MTAEQYNDLLAQIERRNASEPLLPLLRGGYTAANAVYMKHAARRLPIEVDEGPDVEEPEAMKSNADDTLRGLWRERTRLFGEMNKQSNRFHDCRTDEERGDNSRMVLAWWGDILAVKAKIRYYEQHGELPAEVADPASELPDNAAALAKRINALRVQISQRKSQLVELAGLDESTPGKAGKIEKLEKEIRERRHWLGLAEEKMKVI